MLVSTAMLSFIVLGLTAMLIQTQRAFKTGIRQNTITDSGRSIMDMIEGDLAQMSDAQNSGGSNGNYFYGYNFYWQLPPNVPTVISYMNAAPIRTNQLDAIFILEHTNTTWVAVGYAVSNYPSMGIGSLYRYEISSNSLLPAITNDFFSAFNAGITSTNFPGNYWHRVADGVIDLRIRAFDQFGNENFSYYTNGPGGFFGSCGYPLYPKYSYYPSNTLPNSVELELGMLEPDTLIQARALSGNPVALKNFLNTNSALNMEVFRQRITIAAATR
jgi:hypothetical protein